MLLENNPYPQDVRVRQEAEALTAAGYAVTVICPSALEQPWQGTYNGVRVYRYPAALATSGFLGYLWEYSYSMAAVFVLSWLVFFREGFDVVHAHNPPDTFVFVAAFYKLLGKRFIYDHHDLAPEMYYARFGDDSNRLVYHALITLEKFSCKLANHVITTNQSYKAVEMQRGGVSAERITIVRNGPGLADLDWLRSFQPAPYHPLVSKEGKIIIGYAGVMGFQDGVDCLLRALRHLIYDLHRSDVYCILVGGGDALDSLGALSRELELDDHVLFTGWIEGRDGVYNYLSQADICVAPEPSNDYNDRSTMIKITEYMTLAKPIVAFDLPEHRFTAQAAALYAKPNDEFEFARALAQLMDDPARRQTMGTFGRHRIESSLSWQHSIPNLLRVYSSLSLRLHDKPQNVSRS